MSAKRKRVKPSKRKTPRALRRLSERFQERRYEAGASQRAVIGTVLMSLGGVALGVAAYGMVLRDESLPPVPYLPYVLVAGIVLVLAYALFGAEGTQPLRVGELGVGFERDERVTRTAWYELKSISLAHDALSLKWSGKPFTLPLNVYGAACSRIVAEALARIPQQVDLDEEDIARIGEPSDADGALVDAEPPQVAGLHCAASDEPLTFEKDVRMCRRCGVLYDKKGVPRVCVACDAKLKRA